MSNLISQSTLDTFRVQVFRPRLAVFVLILLVTTSTTTSSTAPPAPSTFFSFPTPSLNLLLHPNVLPTFTPLTILLGVRLASMVIEDHIQQSTTTSTSTHTSTSSTSNSHPFLINYKHIFLISSLAFLSVLSTTNWFIKALHNWAINLHPTLQFEVPILPLNVMVMIELSTTLLSLLSPLCKLAPSLPLFPTSISIPSPSHSPTIRSLLRSLGLGGGLRDNSSLGMGSIAGRRRRGMGIGINVNPRGFERHGALPGRIEESEDLPTPNPNSESTSQDSTVTPRAIAAQPNQNQNQNQTSTSTSVPSDELADPLRMPIDPSPSSSSSASPHSNPSVRDTGRAGPETRPKAPKLKGIRVEVETSWFLEAVLALWSRLAGVILYTIITLSLPTLSPTSAPPLLSLLALRTELGALTTVWSTARGRVECLEFVERRWGSNSNTLRRSERKRNDTGSRSRSQEGVENNEKVNIQSRSSSRSTSREDGPNREDQEQEYKDRDSQRCPICFEQVNLYEMPPSSSFKASSQNSIDSNSADEAEKVLDSIYSRTSQSQPRLRLNPKACKLDCGHLLHSMCLVEWLSHQAFCPTCHDKLKATPPTSSSSSGPTSFGSPNHFRRTISNGNGNGNGLTLREAMIRAAGRDNFADGG